MACSQCLAAGVHQNDLLPPWRILRNECLCPHAAQGIVRVGIESVVVQWLNPLTVQTSQVDKAQYPIAYPSKLHDKGLGTH